MISLNASAIVLAPPVMCMFKPREALRVKAGLYLIVKGGGDEFYIKRFQALVKHASGSRGEVYKRYKV